MTLRPPLPHDQSTLRRAETLEPPKPKSCRRAAKPCHTKTKSCTRAEAPRQQKPKTPRQSRQAAPADKPDAANFRQRRPLSSGQSTAIASIQASAAAQRPSSPAAGSVETEARNERRERSCRRSGAAPCCVAVGMLQLRLLRDQSTCRYAETYQLSNPKSRNRAETLRYAKAKSNGKPTEPRHAENQNAAREPASWNCRNADASTPERGTIESCALRHND